MDWAAWRSPESVWRRVLSGHVCCVPGSDCDWDLSVTIDLADLSRQPASAGLFSPVFTPDWQHLHLQQPPGRANEI